MTMNESKALENLRLSKLDLDGYLNTELNSKQWYNIKDEINGRVDNYIDELLEEIEYRFENGDFDE
jgi:hypothetical protein